MTEERRLVRLEDAITALHVRCQPTEPCSLPYGYEYDVDAWLAALPQPATEPALDEETIDEGHLFRSIVDGRMHCRCDLNALAAQPSAEVRP